MNIHKNARLTAQGRLLLVRRVEELGWRMVEAAKAAVEPVLRLGRSKLKHRAIEPERRPQRRQGRPRLRRLRASFELALAIPIAVMVITVVPAIVAAVPAAMVITAMIIAVPPAPCLGFV